MFPLTIYFFTFVPRAANVTDWLIMQLATQDFFSSVSPPSTKRQSVLYFFFNLKTAHCQTVLCLTGCIFYFLMLIMLRCFSPQTVKVNPNIADLFREQTFFLNSFKGVEHVLSKTLLDLKEKQVLPCAAV